MKKTPTTPKDPELEFPLKTWQFWLIAATTALYLFDTLFQWLVRHSTFEAITSGILFGLLGLEVYARFALKRTYLGKTYSIIICGVLVASFLVLYTRPF